MQLDFLDPPIARKSDPDTSKVAAAKYDGEQRQNDKAALLDLIRRYPGHTAAEYSELFRNVGMHWYKAARMPTRRVHDLVNAGDVRAGEPRICCVTGERAQVYYSAN